MNYNFFLHIKNKKRYLSIAFLFIITFSAFSQNPLRLSKEEVLSIPDVCFQPVGDIVNAFSGYDSEDLEDPNKIFSMPFWQVYSSKDLLNWTLESRVYPEDTYIGKSNQCWASHAVYKNDKWYWYLSNWHDNTGVVVANSVKGPWVDPLKKPLLAENLTPTREYDSSVFIEDNGAAYIVFGINGVHGYHIAELNEDMISLKTTPKRIDYDFFPVKKATDAPFLHKVENRYYLSSRTEYAISDSINGPFKYMGSHEARGHGGYFTFKNQTYINFTELYQGKARKLRGVGVSYVHYRNDGSIAPLDKKIMSYGVGQYDAAWSSIEAEWFFEISNKAKKTETATKGFEISNIKNGAFLKYPNIHNFPKKSMINLTYSSAHKKGGNVSVRLNNKNGKEIGKAKFKPTGSWDTYKTISIDLKKGNVNETKSIAFVFEGEDHQDLIHVDKFCITSNK